jgi:hypothetical protein
MAETTIEIENPDGNVITFIVTFEAKKIWVSHHRAYYPGTEMDAAAVEELSRLAELMKAQHESDERVRRMMYESSNHKSSMY